MAEKNPAEVSADEMTIESGVEAEITVGEDKIDDPNVIVAVSNAIEKVKPFNIKFDADANEYRIEGLDSFETFINGLLTRIRKYDYSDDDRTLFRTSKADIVKVRNALVKAIKDEQVRMFGPVDADRKRIEKLINDVVDELKKSLDESDRKAREAKRKPLEIAFNDVKLNSDDLFEELVFNDILDERWLNRSFSEKNAIKEMDERLGQVKSIVELGLMPEKTAAQVLISLRENAWSTTDAVKEYRDEQERKAAMEALAEKRKAEAAAEAQRIAAAEAAENDAPARVNITLNLKVDDAGRVLKMLDAAGIDYVLATDDERREEVVRCRDCGRAYQRGGNIYCSRVLQWGSNDKPVPLPVNLDGFCAWGERGMDDARLVNEGHPAQHRGGPRHGRRGQDTRQPAQG